MLLKFCQCQSNAILYYGSRNKRGFYSTVFYGLYNYPYGRRQRPCPVVVSGAKPDGVTLASHRAGATEQRLIRRLLRDYDVDARGVRKLNSTVTVEIQLLLLRIQGLVSNVNLFSSNPT